jgi:hypothetical protein
MGFSLMLAAMLCLPQLGLGAHVHAPEELASFTAQFKVAQSSSQFQCLGDEECVVTESVEPCSLDVGGKLDWAFFPNPYIHEPAVSYVNKIKRKCHKKEGRFGTIGNTMYRTMKFKKADAEFNNNCVTTWTMITPSGPIELDQDDGASDADICKMLITQKNGDGSAFQEGVAMGPHQQVERDEAFIASLGACGQMSDAAQIIEEGPSESSSSEPFCKCIKKADESRCIMGCVDERYQKLCKPDYVEKKAANVNRVIKQHEELQEKGWDV